MQYFYLIIFCRVISTLFDVIRVHRPFWKCLQYQGLLEGPDSKQAPPDVFEQHENERVEPLPEDK